MSEAASILPYTDQPNGSSISIHHTADVKTYRLHPIGWVWGYNSLSRWLRRNLLWGGAFYGAIILGWILWEHKLQRSTPLDFPVVQWLLLVLGFLCIQFIDNWLVHGRRRALICIFPKHICISSKGLFRTVDRAFGREEIRSVAVSEGKLRFYSKKLRTIAAVDCCRPHDMLWLASKLREDLDLPEVKLTWRQRLRDWLTFRW